MTEPAGDESLLLRFQIAVRGFLHNIPAQDHGRSRRQKADEHRGDPRIHPPVVEQSIQILLGQLDLLPSFQHPLEVGNEIQGQ